MINNYNQSLGKDKNFLKCGRFIANYFIYDCKIPQLSIDSEERYVFLYNKMLKDAIDKMSIRYKVALWAEGYYEDLRNIPV